LGGRYSHINARFVSGLYKDKHIPFVPHNRAQLYIKAQLKRHLIFYSSWSFTGKRFATGDMENNSQPLRAHGLLNANLRWQKSHYFINFRINNVFNRHYSLYSSYSPLQNQRYFYPAPGRYISLTLGTHLNV
jgi:outer membrane receptor protein involved in Fe transport